MTGTCVLASTTSGPAPHVAQILGAYFPDEKLLYVGDLLDVLTEELVIAGVDAVPMRRKIRELGLDVQRFVPVHGLPITGEQLKLRTGSARSTCLRIGRADPARVPEDAVLVERNASRR